MRQFSRVKNRFLYLIRKNQIQNQSSVYMKNYEPVLRKEQRYLNKGKCKKRFEIVVAG